jgi:DNA-binding CsgD family transcriptional regulator
MIVLHRPLDAEPFNAHERRWVHYLHHELQPHIGRSLADAGSPVAQLSPRLRQALKALLDGLSEQQIAERLNIAASTAHDYVTQLYRHFNVNSRAQLQAAVRLPQDFDPRWTPDALRRHRRLRPAMPLSPPRR